MPITIKSTGMKYKNPDTGVYQGVDMLEEATIRDVIVDVYSPTSSYSVGKHCLYNGELYCCTTAIPEGGEAWNLAHWEKTKVTDELEDIKGAVDSIGSDDVANESNVSGTTVSDALDTLDGVISSLGSDDVANESNVSGTTVSDALDTLDGAITSGTLLDGMPQTEMQILANSNLNNYTTAGTYWVMSDGDAATIANMPRVASGTLYVVNRSRGNYKTQIYYPTTSINLCYSRNYNNGSWTDWDYRALISEVERDVTFVTTNVFDKCAKENTTSNGVSFSWRGDGAVILNGTSTAEGYNSVYFSTQSFPCGLEAGGTYRAAMFSTNSHCYVTLLAYVNSAWQQIVNTNGYSFSTFTIPSNATGAWIRVTVESGYSFSAVVGRPVIYSAQAAIDWNLMGVGGRWIPSGSNLNDITIPGTYCVPSDAVAQSITNIPRGASGTLYVLNRGDGISYQMQIYIPSSNYQILYTRIKTNGSWGGWTVRGEMIVHTGTVTTSGIIRGTEFSHFRDL